MAGSANSKSGMTIAMLQMYWGCCERGRERYYIFQDLKLSINSKRKGEKGMSKR